MMSIILFSIVTSLSLSSKLSTALDTISPNQTLTDINGDTLVSTGEAFELGFFSPPNSNNRYVGIWFKQVSLRTPIWVANKNNPLRDSSGVLTITTTGNVVITSKNQTNMVIWSSNSFSSSTTAINAVLQLLDNGNLVVKINGGKGNYLWQSFDYPCDTLVPGMKLGWNMKTNKEWYITSWKSLQDPSSGDYTCRLDRLPQIVLHKGSNVMYRSGPWDGVRFGGGPPLNENEVVNHVDVFNSTYAYYSFENVDETIISRFVVNQTGLLQYLRWNEKRGEWDLISIFQSDFCDTHDICGAYGLCNINDSPVCRCPDGFAPKSPHEWSELDWSGGCVRREAVDCGAAAGFKKFWRLKWPDASHWVNKSEMNQVDCEATCLRNCSCVAYAIADVSGCMVWFGDLLDIREYDEGARDLYIRVAASELDGGVLEKGSNKNKRTAVIASVTVISVLLVLALISWYVIRNRTGRWRGAQRLNNQRQQQVHDNKQSIVEEDLELPLFDLATISTATKNFSFESKIGEGGFGPVYKGKFSNEQEIAVKRLSKTSGQGLNEFKNEVILISKLQHRNLVRVLGCCIHKEERMLIYEYMPNGSLDLFLFNQARGTSLDWKTRFDVIVGIARGLLYLHRDSRLRIIHRDLKASNILLDHKMNPKISDFGLARTFGGDQSEEKTNRVVGTYGYMSPEYVINGQFSVKSDIFSFGVLVLEIISGKKNRGFYHPAHDLNLLGHAWKLWNDGEPTKLIDAFMESLVLSEVLRCIQVALLCVQNRPDDRPTMSVVLSMLDSENQNLPRPKQPGFYSERFPTDRDCTSTGKKPCTSNEVTITMLHGR